MGKGKVYMNNDQRIKKIIADKVWDRLKKIHEAAESRLDMSIDDGTIHDCCDIDELINISHEFIINMVEE